jgi:Uma2 family endonuclease
MGMAAPVYYSAEMVRALPDDGKRYETVRGELLVTPAPGAWLQEIVARLVVRLRTWLEEHPVGHLLQSPADISWGPDILVQPDLFVVRLEEARTMDWTRMKHLLLVIEVLSPTTARADRFTKRRLYQDVGVPRYWMVDPDREAVEVWSPDAAFPTIERTTLTWQPAGTSDAFRVSVQELFRPV